MHMSAVRLYRMRPLAVAVAGGGGGMGDSNRGGSGGGLVGQDGRSENPSLPDPGTFLLGPVTQFGGTQFGGQPGGAAVQGGVVTGGGGGASHAGGLNRSAGIVQNLQGEQGAGGAGVQAAGANHSIRMPAGASEPSRGNAGEEERHGRVVIEFCPDSYPAPAAVCSAGRPVDPAPPARFEPGAWTGGSAGQIPAVDLAAVREASCRRSPQPYHGVDGKITFRMELAGPVAPTAPQLWRQSTNPFDGSDCSENSQLGTRVAVVHADCKHALDSGASTGDGWYLIDPTGGDATDAYEVYCIMEDASVGGGWTLLAKLTSNDVARSWTCDVTPGCRGTLWNNEGVLNEGAGRGWGAEEDAKYASYNQVAAEDLMFYDIANGYPLVMVEGMMAGRTFQELIDQVPDTGACTCCSQEFAATFVKTGVGMHPFCVAADGDCTSNARLGLWCRDEEAWGTRDFNLFGLPNDNLWDYNYGQKPGLGTDRFDSGHGGGTHVDVSCPQRGDWISDARRWTGGAVGIFVRGPPPADWTELGGGSPLQSSENLCQS